MASGASRSFWAASLRENKPFFWIVTLGTVGAGALPFSKSSNAMASPLEVLARAFEGTQVVPAQQPPGQIEKLARFVDSIKKLSDAIDDRRGVGGPGSRDGDGGRCVGGAARGGTGNLDRVAQLTEAANRARAEAAVSRRAVTAMRSRGWSLRDIGDAICGPIPEPVPPAAPGAAEVHPRSQHQPQARCGTQGADRQRPARGRLSHGGLDGRRLQQGPAQLHR